MKKMWLTMCVLATLALAGCAASAPMEEEAMAPGPDPTVVDTDRYTTEFENDRVRVLRIKYGPGEKSVMHYHPDAVAVFLTDHKGRFTLPDGTTQDIGAKAGEAIWTDAGAHHPENLADEAFELIQVELKDADGDMTDTRATAPDPTEVDADHYKTEFENDRVRIIRIQYGPGEKSVMHYHPDAVAVFLTDHKVRFHMPDDTSQEVEMTAGKALWTDRGPHLPENIGDKAIELVLIELK